MIEGFGFHYLVDFDILLFAKGGGLFFGESIIEWESNLILFGGSVALKHVQVFDVEVLWEFQRHKLRPSSGVC